MAQETNIVAEPRTVHGSSAARRLRRSGFVPGVLATTAGQTELLQLNAHDFEREVASKIKEQNETGKSFDNLPVDHGKAVASAFAGMTLAEFNAYIQEFKKQPMPSYTGMTRGSGFYLPMVQIVEYLQANDFTVYIVSGTDRLIVRGIFDGNVLDVPNRQIIGSDETIVARGQGGTDGLNYFFEPDDALILGGDFLIKNLKMNKVSVIAQEIGAQPVLSFGNSSGDNSMAEYVVSNNPHRSLAFMLCCDDLARENGNLAKAQKMADYCAQYGWIPISMKNDWTTIYGDGVTYLGAEEAGWASRCFCAGASRRGRKLPTRPEMRRRRRRRPRRRSSSPRKNRRSLPQSRRPRRSRPRNRRRSPPRSRRRSRCRGTLCW